MQNSTVNQKRIRIITGVVITLGILVVAKLFILQIIKGESYRAEAEKQYITPRGNTFDRGTIFFSTGKGATVAAATIETGYKVAIVPAKITDPEKTFEALRSYLSIDKADFLIKAEKKADPYEEIATRISQEDGDAIAALGLSGVQLYRDKWRFYPGGAMAAKTIGFVSYKGDDLVGTSGLEAYYNDVLGRHSNNFHVNFFAEIFANVQSVVFKNGAVSGDVVTTIDPAVQTQLEDIVSVVQQEWSSDAVGGVVVDPYTGEVLAMANVPTFDLNNFGAEKGVSIYTNPLSQNVYEMGSIIKPIVMAGAIDAGAVTPNTTYTDQGSIVVADRTINNFDKKGRGTITMQEVLSQSLNTGMVFAQQKMGKPAFKEYMLERFKLGTKTGVDLPSEGGGLVSNLKENNDVNYATASFGQGIATTPLNIVRAFGALANGGHLVTPHLARAIVTTSGEYVPLEFDRSQEVISAETARAVTDMLVYTVDNGYNRGLKHYSVAAKTGTAQIAKPNGQGYYDDRNLHSLIGYFPAEKPRFVLYLYNVYPKGALYAIQTLATPFFDMVEFLTSYYQITPDR